MDFASTQGKVTIAMVHIITTYMASLSKSRKKGLTHILHRFMFVQRTYIVPSLYQEDALNTYHARDRLRALDAAHLPIHMGGLTLAFMQVNNPSIVYASSSLLLS